MTQGKTSTLGERHDQAGQGAAFQNPAFAVCICNQGNLPKLSQPAKSNNETKFCEHSVNKPGSKTLLLVVIRLAHRRECVTLTASYRMYQFACDC